MDTKEADQKLIWVADYLYYPINISEIEKQIISTQIFNRLHNVLQNSTVYFTYPSNRTSRFSHSLGTMHLTGEVVRNGFLNATPEDQVHFLNDLVITLEKVESSDSFISDVNSLYMGRDVEAMQVTKNYIQQIMHPLYHRAMPGNITTVEQQNAFIIAFQAVRITALLHDLGHPPFSHITEQALDQLFLELSSKKAGGLRLTNREKNFLQILDYYKRYNKQIHEEIGYHLVESIFNELIDKAIGVNHGLCYAYLLIRHFVQEILAKNTKEESEADVFWALHRIVDSDLDTDRLDYVQRDISMSGLSRDPIKLERLLSSMQLIYHSARNLQRPMSGEAAIIEFLPSVRALSTIEEFYHRRIDLYKYIIFHHRVVKTDGLLQQSIVKVAQMYLQEEADETTEEHKSLLPLDISGLWKVLNRKNTRFTKDVINQYFQWDDVWLLSILRRSYFQLREKTNTNKLPEQLLEIQLEEILSNKRSYYSLFKRVDSFVSVDEAFLNAIPNDFNWHILTTFASTILRPGEEGTATQLVEQISNYHRAYIQASLNPSTISIRELREQNGFFLARMRTLFSTLNITASFVELLQNSLQELQAEHNLNDAFFIRKTLTPGITNNFHLVQGNQVITLGTVSRLADELRKIADFFPPFYVYIYNEQKNSEQMLEQVRKDFGRCLWHSLSKLLYTQPDVT